MCKKRWQRGRSQKCSIRVSRLIGRRCKIGVDNCRRQLHLLTEDTEGSNSVSAECCWDFGMQIKSSSAITAMKIKTLYYWKRFQKCKEVLKLTATRQRKTHWTRKYCGSEPYPRETITGCVCMYVKFIYIAHLSCKHATNDAEVQSSVFGTTNFIGKMRYWGGGSLVSIWKSRVLSS
jgi:hypothetical protein